MSKDYKPKAKSSPAPRGGGGSSAMAGVLVGLCLGIAIAVAAVLYLNKTGNPFQQKVESAAKAPLPATPKQPEVMKPQGAGGSEPPPAVAPESKFDFYKILPGQEQADSKPAPIGEDKATPAVVPAKGTYLQVGAFQNETEADNLKAKLAMLGMEASIQSSEVEGKGLVHRVRLGPIAKADDLDRLRAQLKVNGMDAAVVKQ